MRQSGALAVPAGPAAIGPAAMRGHVFGRCDTPLSCLLAQGVASIPVVTLTSMALHEASASLADVGFTVPVEKPSTSRLPGVGASTLRCAPPADVSGGTALALARFAGLLRGRPFFSVPRSSQ
jgi:hypothetical protein